ncbi:hypothetical protein ANCCEY_11328 [Ancylostoma ceylanicum]|uniref:Uncharacterized protein n=1 Tax=Ancylostoma ceylanicum TaxID=53326 RepID=A0A0D6LCG8_9BILA|nr:hypothetical protein ANCCEY_11328 [Ancylostoma ceylanicum]
MTAVDAFVLHHLPVLTIVYTVEYQKTKIIGTTKIEYVHPVDFAEQWKEYGDPIDPNGDLREVLKVMCLLKKGGERNKFNLFSKSIVPHLFS